MSNQVDHRAPKNRRNSRRKERCVPAHHCGGEGHNGQIGRSKWKKLSRRNERRNAKQGRPATIGKMPSRIVDTGKGAYMINGELIEDNGRRGKTHILKPQVPDTGEDE
jgi:hypothetical protein